jgi:DNA-binding CsgD family transcriptional regulator
MILAAEADRGGPKKSETGNKLATPPMPTGTPRDLLVMQPDAALDRTIVLIWVPAGFVKATGSPSPTLFTLHGAGPLEHTPLVEPLTAREREVLRILAADASNAEIARALVLTVGTVKTHVHHILGKLGVQTRRQAAVKAAALGLL